MARNLMKAAVVFAVGFAAPAFACSYYIDQAAAKARVIQLAQVTQGISDANLVSSDVAEFRFFESKPTPMCPAEVTFTGVVSLRYKDTVASVTCDATFAVTHAQPWVDGQPDRVTVLKQTESCK